MANTALSGLDLLATAVMLVDESGTVRYMNSAAENLFGLSNQNAEGEPQSSDPSHRRSLLRCAAQSCARVRMVD